MQDAYVAALEREEIFSHMNEYQIKGWFFTTIKNKNIDNIRKFNRLDYLGDKELIISLSEGFEEQVVMKELLHELPEKYKKVISLRYEMNLNSKEIGEILDISPSTVRSQISTALKILRNYL